VAKRKAAARKATSPAASSAVKVLAANIKDLKKRKAAGEIKGRNIPRLEERLKELRKEARKRAAKGKARPRKRTSAAARSGEEKALAAKIKDLKKRRAAGEIKGRHIAQLEEQLKGMRKRSRTPAADKTVVGSTMMVFGDIYQRLEDPSRGAVFEVFCESRIEIRSGDYISLLGPSGCGKTTLLTLLGLLRRPFDLERIGTFEIHAKNNDGEDEVFDIRELWESGQMKKIEQLRRKHMGFSLQSGELLASLNVRENIATPMRLNGFSDAKIKQRLDELIDSFGLANSKSGDEKRRIEFSRTNKLSGGEYQRVVLARAISHRPALVFVDEPTAALNRELARVALQQLKNNILDPTEPGAVIMITHDEELAREFSTRIIRMEAMASATAGRVVEVADNSPVY
jgi:ABC-type lipoprotein export system ATPase subunit